MKFIKKGNQLTIFLKDGTALSNTISDEDYQLFLDGDMQERELIKLLSPEYTATLDEIENKKSLLEKVKDSNILTLKGDSIYMESVSQFSIPSFFVDKIIEAENILSKSKPLTPIIENAFDEGQTRSLGLTKKGYINNLKLDI